MAEIKLYENVEDLIELNCNRFSLSEEEEDHVSRLVHYHIAVCLSNEALAGYIGPDPIFNITYIDKLVEQTGAAIYDIRCMLSLLQMTKDRKEAVSNWDLLYKRAVSEINRRVFDPDYTPLLEGLK